MYVFKSLNLIGFLIFFVANNTNDLTFKIYMLVGYIIDYVHNYFHIFLKLVNMIFIFLKTMRSLMSRSQKHFPKDKWVDGNMMLTRIGQKYWK
jgi:hypothetical protein